MDVFICDPDGTYGVRVEPDWLVEDLEKAVLRVKDVKGGVTLRLGDSVLEPKTPIADAGIGAESVLYATYGLSDEQLSKLERHLRSTNSSDWQELLPANLEMSLGYPVHNDSRAVALLTAKTSGKWFRHASDRLKSNEEFLCQIAKDYPEVVQHADLSQSGLLRVLGVQPEAMKYVNSTLATDRSFVLKALEATNGACVFYISPSLREDREVALSTVSFSPLSLKMFAGDVRDDREVVLAAVQGNGMCLKYASARLRADREVVLAAVSDYGKALEYSMVIDTEIVLEALRTAPRGALVHVPQSKWRSRDFVLSLLQGIPSPSGEYDYVDDNLWSDPIFVAQLAAVHPWSLEHATAYAVTKEAVLAALACDVAEPALAHLIPEDLLVLPEVSQALSACRKPN